jgi:membrane protein DedA with SNARE-associated domain
MNFKTFSIYTFMGALPWTALFAWLGVKMGANWELIREKLHNFDLTILILVILAVTLYIWRHVKHSRSMSQTQDH